MFIASNHAVLTAEMDSGLDAEKPLGVASGRSANSHGALVVWFAPILAFERLVLVELGKDLDAQIDSQSAEAREVAPRKNIADIDVTGKV